MRFDILSLFPQIADATLSESIIGRARSAGLVEIHSHNIRDWATDKHHTVDDTPYGGGQGMVMKCEPVFAAVEAVKRPGARVVFMTPAGRPFTQAIAQDYASAGTDLILLCGHYEGIDQRIIDALVDDEISIGDYVLTNGAIAAVVFTDAVVRLIPGVLGHALSAQEESFSAGMLEGPQYTRPVEHRGAAVPDVLLSGNHAAIAKWRKQKAQEKTERVRPDLLQSPPASSL